FGKRVGAQSVLDGLGSHAIDRLDLAGPGQRDSAALMAGKAQANRRSHRNLVVRVEIRRRPAPEAVARQTARARAGIMACVPRALAVGWTLDSSGAFSLGLFAP